MSKVTEEITNGLARVLTLAGLFSLVGTAVGQSLGALWWVADLACHFTFYYATALAPAALLLLAPTRFRRTRLGCAFAGALLVNLLLLAPLYWPASTPQAGGRLKVMSLNVLTSNARYHDVLALVDREDPDVLVLMEVDRAWANELEPLAERYDTVESRPRSDNFGIALYTRLPADNIKTVELAASLVPTISVTLHEGTQAIAVLATHPLPPVNAGYARSRNRQLREVAKWAAAQPGPTVVLGDLNSTRWSPLFRQLLRESGLKDSAAGCGRSSTWFVGNMIGIPIDHVLHSQHLSVVERRVGPDVGSDHRAVIVEFSLHGRGDR